MSRDAPMLGLLAESLCDVAILEFAVWRGRPLPAPRRTATLPAREIARVREYIVANLTTPMTLSDLSRVAGLSKFHFARAFKATVGCSPYQDVLRHGAATARGRRRPGGCRRPDRLHKRGAAQAIASRAPRARRLIRRPVVPAEVFGVTAHQRRGGSPSGTRVCQRRTQASTAIAPTRSVPAGERIR